MIAMPKVEVKIADEHELGEWDQFVDTSPMGTIFHKLNWLEAAEQESRSHLFPIIGYKGEKIVFILPCFLKNYFGFRLLFSPPPRCLIPEMGIVLNIPMTKQDSFESCYFEVIDSLDSFIRDQFRPDYIRIILPVGFNDLRPFLWKNYVVNLKYTYFISLSRRTEEIFESFKRNVRRDINRAKKNENINVFDGNYKTYMEIVKLVRKRYKDQGLNLNVSDSYLSTIYNQFGKNHIQVKAIQRNNNLLTGIVWLKHKEKVRAWLGGIAPLEKISGLNELLHWEITSESVEEEYRDYDLVGANTAHLCHHKSRYNPDLKVYYELEKTTLKGQILLSAYNAYKSYITHKRVKREHT